MKQTRTLFTLLLLSTLLNAQVGINNTNPKASLDISATNQASPSNTDGLLIPRIDTFPATAPTSAQQGMMVYLTTASGGNAPGYYYWDNGTSLWKAMLNTGDSDFYEDGGTPPNNITDDIYTLGRVKIGSSTFIASDGALNVDSNESYSATFTNTNTTAVGARIVLNADNSDIKTGVNITLIGTTSGAPYINSGLKFTDLLVGNQQRIGIYQSFLGTNTSNTPLVAIINHFDSSSEYSGQINGLYNSIESIGDGRHIGVENILKSNGDGFHYGTRNTLEGTGIGSKYDSYNYISNAVGGTHYGVYSDVQSPTGFAGYLLGRLSLGNTSVDRYIMPSADGTANQIMQTNGIGQVSFVDPTTVGTDDQVTDVFQLTGTNLELSLENDGVATQTVDLSSLQDGTGTDDQTIDQFGLIGTILGLSLENDGVAPLTVDLSSIQDADWYGTAGTAPNSIGDDIYTNGKVGINTTPDTRLHLKHFNNGTTSGFKLENANTNSWRLYVSSGATGEFRFYSSVNGNALTAKIDGVSGVYTAVSDRRLKKDLNNLHFQWEEFMKLKPLTYRFKTQKNEKKYIGLVAQDVDKIYPELVSYTKDEDVYQLDYSATGIIAIKAVQELKKEVEILSQENQELKKQIKKYENLEARLSSLENNLTIALYD